MASPVNISIICPFGYIQTYDTFRDALWIKIKKSRSKLPTTVCPPEFLWNESKNKCLDDF